MFSRGRPCLKRRGLAVAASPEEPLLFLYPRWFTSTLHQRRPISSIETPASIGRTRQAPHTNCRLPRKLSFGVYSRRWISCNSATAGTGIARTTDDLPQESSSVSTTENEYSTRRSTTAEKHNLSTGSGSRPPIPRKTRGANSPSHNPKRRHVFNAFSDIQAKTTSPPPSTAKGTNNSNNASSPDRALVAMKRLSVRDRRKLRYRLFLTKRLHERGGTNRLNQWTKMRDWLEHLQQDTRIWAKKGIKQKEMLIPEETVALLAGVTEMAMNENIWYVPVHNGCKVHVLHPLESDGRYRKVILSASERVVELVGDRISHTRDLQERGDPLVDIYKPNVAVFPSIEAMRRRNLPVPLIRGVWDFYSAQVKPAKLDLILPLSKNLTTVREFAEHVEELTKSQPLFHKRADGHVQSHQKRVAKALVDVFRDDANRNVLSTAALNCALSFLCDHEFLGSARAVFLRTEHVTTVDTINILLRSAAKRQDFQMFRQYLLVMSRMSIRPDPYTWVAFLGCLVSPRAKANMVTYMLQKGYLNQTGAVRSALQSTVQDSFLAHLESGKSVDSFINMTIDTYGTNWFPPSLINQMVSVTVRLRDFQALDRLLEISKQQGLSLNSSTIYQITRLFRSDIFSALRYLWRCIGQPETKLKKDAMERLFLIAFKGRHFNICRVLWRYACMHGTVTYKMKQSVLSSVSRNVARNKGKDFDNIWRTSAGKVIVGIDLHISNYPQKSSLLDGVPSEFHENPVSYLASGFKPNGKDRERQLRLAGELTQRDIEVGRWYRPARPLSIMLEAAAMMDLEWKSIPRPTSWLMQNAINVPVTRSVYPR
ncbi:hypothetical protein FE257_007646 [Aspergillus nanangensis]|uniref:Uncharacterized protein n=1 Tax=Aspergillus nanangensis TaxID=2582783 RepID=A0AAD4CP65_ASPNN|nr:hypothetical protein FE257_007646 [Aspergillus nanangensis]